MEALLRQSRGVCPFLKKTSPATLRVLSATPASSAANYATAAGAGAAAPAGVLNGAVPPPQHQQHLASPGGSRMSNLQVLARRCPVMGKALAVQSARHRLAGVAGVGGVGGMGGVGVAGAAKAYHAKAGGARFHSDAQKDAQAVDVGFRPKFPGG
jgi:5-aminolevulinate synthase